MTGIVNQPIAECNSLPTNVREQAPQITPFSQLPKLHQKLIRRYYDAHCRGAAKCFWKITELAMFYKRDPTYISTCLRELEEWGWLKSEHCGSRAKNRWITEEGFYILDNQPQSQIQSQIKVIPYIDLSKNKSDQRSDNKDFECAKPKPFIDPNLTPEEAIEFALTQAKVRYTDRLTIKDRLNRSRIGSEATFRLANGFLWAFTNKAIGSHKAYACKAIENEKKRQMNFVNYLINNNSRIMMQL